MRAADAVFLDQIPNGLLPLVGPPAGHGHHEESNRGDIHDRGSLHQRLKSRVRSLGSEMGHYGRLYAHPERLPPGANREFDVPFVTSDRSRHYSITNSPLPQSEVLRIVPLEHASWQATRVVYVVRRG